MRILEPARGTYRKISPKFQTCQFCAPSIIKDQGIPQLETTYWRTFVCKYPYMDGNLMIIPKRHIEYTHELTVDEWKDFTIALKKAQSALTKIFKTESFNLGLNIGPESGRSIPHLHWMLLPRQSKMRNYPVFEALNDFFIVTMDYKKLKKQLQQTLKKSKKRA